MNIFVAKLDYSTQEDSLRTVFEEFGTVDSAKIILDKFTGKSRGFGFVEMPNDDEAQSAIESLDNTDLDGRTIVVKKAEPRGENSRGGGGGGRGGNRGGHRDSYDRGGRGGW